MPQLWTETFVSQYFWLLVVLFTFYYFIATKVIPNIGEAIKARQITENSQTDSNNSTTTNEKSTHLFSAISKHDSDIKFSTSNWETIQTEWLSTNPEDNNSYWVDTNLSEATILQLEIEEDEELNLEEFLQTNNNENPL